MKTIDILLPAMGEGITDATITRWMVSEGDMIDEDQSLLEVATDKVDSEIPSPVKGKISKILFKVGDVPKVGQVLALVEVEGKEEILAPAKPEKNQVESTSKIKLEEKTISEKPEDNSFAPFISPLVRSIAKQENLSNDDLKLVKGTGLNNRITKDDIVNYLDTRLKKINEVSYVPQKEASKQVINEPSDGALYEVIKMDRMRKLISEHMVKSKQTSAHVTSFIEIDVTNLVAARERLKSQFQNKEGEKLTYTPFFIECTVSTIKQHMLINSSVDDDKIIIKKSINIGIATTLPSGNLIVPVIRNADRLNLTGITKSLNDLAKRARENQLKPDEIQGGTFTITNLGMFDTLTGTPIINQPQVAILSIGAINKRPVVIETPSGDTIGIRQMAMLSLSHDHRVIDGALAGAFLKTLRDKIQSINSNYNL